MSLSEQPQLRTALWCQRQRFNHSFACISGRRDVWIWQSATDKRPQGTWRRAAWTTLQLPDQVDERCLKLLSEALRGATKARKCSMVSSSAATSRPSPTCNRVLPLGPISLSPRMTPTIRAPISASPSERTSRPTTGEPGLNIRLYSCSLSCKRHPLATLECAVQLARKNVGLQPDLLATQQIRGGLVISLAIQGFCAGVGT